MRCAPPPTAIRTIRSCCTGSASPRRRRIVTIARSRPIGARSPTTPTTSRPSSIARFCRSIAAPIATRRAGRSKASSASWSSIRRRGSWRARTSGSPSSSCKRATWRRRDAIWRPRRAKRRDGDALLSEELAQALADAYELDAAEREAKRALSAGRHDAAAGAGRGGAASRAAAQGARRHRGGGHVAARGCWSCARRPR